MTNWMMDTWILDTMVSMTLLMAVVLIIRKPVSHYFGAHIAYLLWALPLARLFMPTLTLKAPAPVESAEAAVAAPLLSDIAITASDKISATSAAVSAAVSELASIDWMMIALVIWIGGAGMLFISKLAAYFQFREDIVSDGQLVGRHGRIKILETAAVGGPLAFGLFEKYIAVPTNFFRDYAPRERELALEHEIAHHESGDLAANFVGLLVLSLHWFNPVAWYAWTAFRQDQETACDARVLQKGGRDLRAVYGRTIAKSVSGHQLGLASPLNQKNKIKDRLKMLGQTEKSTLRKRMGALMVGASTVVALPLTATVTYAVEAEAHLNEDGQESMLVIHGEAASPHSQPKAKLTGQDFQKADAQWQNAALSRAEAVSSIPPMAPVPPAPPAAPVAPAAPDNIIMPSGDEQVHRVSYNGRTIIMRTGAKPSKEEIRNMTEDARREAQEELREAEIARQEARQEMRTALAEARRDVREAQREAHEAQRDARNAQREAMAAAREAQQQAREAKSMAARIWEISEITFKPYFRSAVSSAHQSSSSADCVAVSKKIAFSGTHAVAWTYVEANAGCSQTGQAPQMDQADVDQKAALTVALKSLENKRAIAARCSDKDGYQELMVETYDRGIKDLKTRLSLT